MQFQAIRLLKKVFWNINLFEMVNCECLKILPLFAQVPLHLTFSKRALSFVLCMELSVDVQ